MTHFASVKAAMLLYILLRFIAFQSQWPHSFTRLFTIVRGIGWLWFETTKSAEDRIEQLVEQQF